MRAVDRSKPIPYYYQVSEILKEEIEARTWPPANMIPSEAELAKIFGVSRTVIRKALDALEDDGQVYRVKGKGTVVAPPKFRYEAIPLARDWKRETNTFRPHLARVVDGRRVVVGGLIGSLLKLPSSTEVFELTLMHAIKDTPASLSQMFLRMDASTKLLKSSLSAEASPILRAKGPDILIQLAQDYGLVVTEQEMTLEATRANEFESEMLLIAVGTPVFLVSSLEFKSGRSPVSYTRTVVRSDQFSFSIKLQRSANQPDSEFEFTPFIGGQS